MAMRVSAAAMEGIHTLYHWGAMGNWGDSQLVAHFLTDEEGSEAAFRVLIHRHGPMVLGVCRRILGDEHTAEDAFQTTFLVFVKKAGRLRDRELLTNWLYGVALRVATKEKVKGARRRNIESKAAAAATDATHEHAQFELRSVIDEEIRRLPERYRVPLVLCHLEGRRHDEVARQLGCPVGTIESRLSRAREQLRTRLTRRGLAPSASVMAVLLKPPGEASLAPSLVEATLRAGFQASAHKALVGSASLTGLSWMERVCRFLPIGHAGTGVSALVVATVVGATSLAIYRAQTEWKARHTTSPGPLATGSTESTKTEARSKSASANPSDRPAPTKRALPDIALAAEKPKTPARFPSATAQPMAGITIDGDLDDWPPNLEKYRINQQLVNHGNYEQQPLDSAENPNAYFQIGYNPEIGQIYLAVVVRDRDVVVHPSNILETDAVEVYIDASFSNRRIDREIAGDWRDTFDAATMPVHQYVGVPGNVSAYGDRWLANPSLVYARTRQTDTRMKFKRTGDVITYEWSIKPFDRFPDRPSQLFPGKHLGFDIAIVDKDSTGVLSKPPTFVTWTLPPGVFRGSDASTLGELILGNKRQP